MSKYLLDTCLLIDHFRGDRKATAFLECLDKPPFLSSLTVAELYAGVREGSERIRLDSLVSILPVLLLDGNIAISGGLYRRQYGKSHGVGIVDALLAATAEQKNLILVTKNTKHFPMLSNNIQAY